MDGTRTCPHCGAPVPGETCPYCGTVFEITPEDYPEVICKFAGVTFREIRLYFSVIAFSAVAAIFLFSQADYGEGILFALIFSLPGLIAVTALIKNIINNLMLSMNGKNTDGEVYGYKDDVIKQGDDHWQIAKVTVNAPDGKKILLVPLHKTTRPYPLNSRVKVRTYKVFAKITKFDLV